MITQDWCYNKRKVPAGAAAPVVWIERQESNMHISYKPLWHTLLERDMRKEDLRLAAGLTTNMIANMGKGEHISMKTLLRICGTLDCDIADVIALERD
ncbi:XRE family transcriptional regulator [Clostridiales bacterium AHG0011]|nr:XRE family transcriptional regulator [Clostridiales bacterium AHG0011]